MSGQGPSGLGRARSADAPPADLLDDESLLDLRRRAKATDPAAVMEEERRQREAAPARSRLGREAALPMPANPPNGGLSAAAAAAAADGLCAICSTRPARGTCTLCGRAACSADLWIMLRLCRSCASEQDVERGQRGAQAETGNWLEGRQ